MDKSSNIIDLSNYIDMIESGRIYEHGYPEDRLIPSNFKELCEEAFLDDVVDEVSEKVREILSKYI